MENGRAKDAARLTPPLTEEELVAVTIGERQPLNSTIYLAPYDPAWPSLFTRLEKQIREALGDAVLLLEHVGSTSVPGLSAKPKIDVVLAVADSSDESSYVPALEERGYTLRVREPDWYEHRLLKPPDVAANLHVFSAGCEEIDRMLLFRDWLRTHAGDRLLYEETKRELAARTWKYTQNYADAKTEVIRAILARARRNRG
ncbi:MAG: GrpB family protein [Anaerolineae bacterium]|nr:GrpB family protein [Anaerolineae bacterium]